MNGYAKGRNKNKKFYFKIIISPCFWFTELILYNMNVINIIFIILVSVLQVQISYKQEKKYITNM